jgi:arylsulfatase A-like enzyme
MAMTRSALKHEGMTRRGFLGAGAAGLAAWALGNRALAAQPAAATPGRRPSILFILTDDLGWGDPACYGNPLIKTPNIDNLAAQGTLFRKFYVASPVCSPSRAAFMTGVYPARLGLHGHFDTHRENVRRRMPDWLDARRPTITRLLRQAGYRTAHFGKWHLGNGPGAPKAADYGIDAAKMFSGPDQGYPGEEAEPFYRAKSTGWLVDDAVAFIKEQGEKPWYINLWTLVPHATLKPTEEELAVYKDLKVAPSQFKGTMREYVRKARNPDAQMQVFAAAVSGLDRALGRLMDALRESGQDGNTLVFFSSDNGPEDYAVANAANAGMGSAGEFRGRKRSLYEGGVRTSCIARWPGRIPAGRVDDTTVLAGVDWLPTIAALCGAGLPEAPFDGEDMRAALLGAPVERSRDLFWEWRFEIGGLPAHKSPPLAMRRGPWKILTGPQGRKPELYNIPVDPGESKNLAATETERVTTMSHDLMAWKASLPV